MPVNVTDQKLAKVRGRKEADFSESVKRTLSAEAGYVCAQPSCGAPTFAAGSTAEEVGKVGEAAHISAAAEGYARWMPQMDARIRRSAANGIWLCNTHAREIDIDEHRHTMVLLHSWKRRAKARALRARGKPKTWVPTGRSELVRTSRTLHMPHERADIRLFTDRFLEDVGGNGFWDSEKLQTLSFALYEMAINAVQHGGAKMLHLRSRGYRVDLVHNGSDFDPTRLLEADGNGGRAAMMYLTEVFGNAISIRYKHNGDVATTQLIDVSVAGPGHPCAVILGRNWVATYRGIIDSCTVVHLFPERALSFSDGGEVDLDLPGANDDTVYVLHDTNHRVVEHFRRSMPMLRAPGAEYVALPRQGQPAPSHAVEI